MPDLARISTHAPASPTDGSRLARHLAIVVTLKLLALTLLWAIFFHNAP